MTDPRLIAKTKELKAGLNSNKPYSFQFGLDTITIKTRDTKDKYGKSYWVDSKNYGFLGSLGFNNNGFIRIPKVPETVAPYLERLNAGLVDGTIPIPETTGPKNSIESIIKEELDNAYTVILARIKGE